MLALIGGIFNFIVLFAIIAFGAIKFSRADVKIQNGLVLLSTTIVTLLFSPIITIVFKDYSLIGMVITWVVVYSLH